MPAANEIPDRKSIADAVCDWMHQHCRDMSIDTLLTWPGRAQQMGRDVCRRLGKKASEENIHLVCRAAMASRKAGDLRRDRY